MRSHSNNKATAFAMAAASSSLASAASLASMCTVSNIQAALPANGTLLGIDALPSSVTAAPVYNATVGGGTNGGVGSSDASGTYNYCNVTLSYAHTGTSTPIALIYAFPAPSDFSNRFYAAGGGGFSLTTEATGGLPYGAASGATDAGYGSLSGTGYDAAVLYGNGSVNWDATYMFAYQALGEMTILGKSIASELYAMGDDEKLYTYFEGCSDGGREAMSQVQRYGGEYDGVVAGAPAFRFAQQQVLHLLSSFVESNVVKYAPPPCEMDKIVNATIDACDGLDGREDGVVSRTDLCKLNFDMESIVGTPYSCAASGTPSSTKRGLNRKRQMPGGGDTYTPAQNGTVTKEGVAVAKGIYAGLTDSKGKLAYLSWQPASSFADAATTWNEDTSEWEVEITSMGGEYVRRFVQLLDLDNLDTLEGVTVDTITNWMKIGMNRFYDSLQTTEADLSEFKNNGGKLIHYHGESDNSIPTASSVHYWQAVKQVMETNGEIAADSAAMNDWYQLYMVPGAGHCGTNSLQPGPFPENNMNIMIDWVENGVQPTGLNATTSDGDFAGETQMLCQFPTRPLWKSETEFDCVNDEKSIESWTYEFDAYGVAVY